MAEGPPPGPAPGAGTGLAPPSVGGAPVSAVDQLSADPRVLWVGAVSALSSGIALVAAIVLDRPLWLSSVFILVPGLIAFTAATTLARRHEQQLFLTRVWRATVAGILATIAYDVSRFVVEVTDLSSTNSFKAMPVFGAGLTELSTNHAGAIAAGWAFHLLNGLGFAVAYMLLLAGRRWWWGVVYALVLEAFMVYLYPGWLGVVISSEFLSVSIIGHICYGAVLGVMAERTP